MGKKARKKKTVDFKKVKLKVGRKLAKGKDVDLSFATKKICIREDKPLLDESSGQKVLSLSRIVPRLHSRHNEELVSALSDLRQWMKKSPDDARQLLLMEMQTGIIPLMRHIESKVRDAARNVFTALLHIVSSTPAYYPYMAQGMFSSLVHIDVGVRASGWEYLRLMLDVSPRILPSLNCGLLLDELSRRVPQECVGLRSKGTINVVKLVERLLATLTPNDSQEEETGVLKVNGIVTAPRQFLFDWDAAGMDRLWLNPHLPRAQEGGLGWAGEPSYTIADFVRDLAKWFLTQVAEFQDSDESHRIASQIDVAARLLSLLTILRIVLRRNFKEPQPQFSFKTYADAIGILWRLFPVPEDVFKGTKSESVMTINMTLLHVKCLLMTIECRDEDGKNVGEYFNASMPAVWPPTRSLCLQWTTCAELCLHPSLVHGKFAKVLVNIVEKIGDTQQKSKIGALCRQIVEFHRNTTDSENT